LVRTCLDTIVALPRREQQVSVLIRAAALVAVAGLLPGVLGLSPAGAVAASADSVHTFLTGTVAVSAADAWTVGWTSGPWAGPPATAWSSTTTARSGRRRISRD
jgi:hypothetical protein